MIDIDRAVVLRRRRGFALTGFAVCMACIGLVVVDVTLPMTVLVGLFAVVFWTHVNTYTAEIESLDLDGESINQRRTRPDNLHEP